MPRAGATGLSLLFAIFMGSVSLIAIDGSETLETVGLSDTVSFLVTFRIGLRVQIVPATFITVANGAYRFALDRTTPVM